MRPRRCNDAPQATKGRAGAEQACLPQAQGSGHHTTQSEVPSLSLPLEKVVLSLIGSLVAIRARGASVLRMPWFHLLGGATWPLAQTVQSSHTVSHSPFPHRCHREPSEHMALTMLLPPCSSLWGFPMAPPRCGPSGSASPERLLQGRVALLEGNRGDSERLISELLALPERQRLPSRLQRARLAGHVRSCAHSPWLTQGAQQ